MQVFSIFALGLPLILLPLMGGIFGALAFRMMHSGIEDRVKWSQFRGDHDELISASREVSSLRHKLIRLEESWEQIVQQPAADRLQADALKIAQLLDLVTRAKLAGDKTITIPGPGGMVITNIDLAHSLAMQARRTLDGYLQREFAVWSENNPTWRN